MRLCDLLISALHSKCGSETGGRAHFDNIERCNLER